ncbi:hypothetical protein EW145_g7720 [Phellinidium pouzarii]|uniref:Peptidase C14 caspase domain-containing protein n=1 Tax=Phellinidium pouzarii TaxID=167371 RepID=A0A4S4KGU5_9AGAM|nr:hypothetical protein EW145_g7720 [Phellinidium pouzarii]
MSGYPGKYHHHHHHHQHHEHQQEGYNYGPPQGPPGQVPGFPSPSPRFGGAPGYGRYNPPPMPPPQGGYDRSYAPSYAPSFDLPYGSYGGQGSGYGGHGDQDSFARPPGPPMNYDTRPVARAPYMPPAGVQSYGPHSQGRDNSGAEPYFQYSQCTGRKKALCIGINYVGQRAELQGCINDAHNVEHFLINHGYNKDDIVMLTDDAHNLRQIPTRSNVLEAMQWLVRDAQPNDSLFFHYSGHGGQTKDLDGDEADGYDEVIYPVDFKDAGHIVDDEMHFIMVKPLPSGCRLTAIFDSCHSGSALDLPYVYSTEGKIKEPNLAAEAGQELLSVVKSYAQKDMQGVFKGAMGLFKTATGNTQKVEQYARQTRTSPADVNCVLLDLDLLERLQGFADECRYRRARKRDWCYELCIHKLSGTQPQQTYQELLINLRGILRDKYSQKPQLSSSHPMDTNIYFII